MVRKLSYPVNPIGQVSMNAGFSYFFSIKHSSALHLKPSQKKGEGFDQFSGNLSEFKPLFRPAAFQKFLLQEGGKGIISLSSF